MCFKKSLYKILEKILIDLNNDKSLENAIDCIERIQNEIDENHFFFIKIPNTNQQIKKSSLRNFASVTPIADSPRNTILVKSISAPPVHRNITFRDKVDIHIHPSNIINLIYDIFCIIEFLNNENLQRETLNNYLIKILSNKLLNLNKEKIDELKLSLSDIIRYDPNTYIDYYKNLFQTNIENIDTIIDNNTDTIIDNNIDHKIDTVIDNEMNNYCNIFCCKKNRIKSTSKDDDFITPLEKKYIDKFYKYILSLKMKCPPE